MDLADLCHVPIRPSLHDDTDFEAARRLARNSPTMRRPVLAAAKRRHLCIARFLLRDLCDASSEPMVSYMRCELSHCACERALQISVNLLTVKRRAQSGLIDAACRVKDVDENEPTSLTFNSRSSRPANLERARKPSLFRRRSASAVLDDIRFCLREEYVGDSPDGCQTRKALPENRRFVAEMHRQRLAKLESQPQSRQGP